LLQIGVGNFTPPATTFLLQADCKTRIANLEYKSNIYANHYIYSDAANKRPSPSMTKLATIVFVRKSCSNIYAKGSKTRGIFESKTVGRCENINSSLKFESVGAVSQA
jgi:hypothetical protein